MGDSAVAGRHDRGHGHLDGGHHQRKHHRKHSEKKSQSERRKNSSFVPSVQALGAMEQVDGGEGDVMKLLTRNISADTVGSWKSISPREMEHKMSKTRPRTAHRHPAGTLSGGPARESQDYTSRWMDSSLIYSNFSPEENPVFILHPYPKEYERQQPRILEPNTRAFQGAFRGMEQAARRQREFVDRYGRAHVQEKKQRELQQYLTRPASNRPASAPPIRRAPPASTGLPQKTTTAWPLNAGSGKVVAKDTVEPPRGRSNRPQSALPVRRARPIKGEIMSLEPSDQAGGAKRPVSAMANMLTGGDYATRGKPLGGWGQEDSITSLALFRDDASSEAPNPLPTRPGSARVSVKADGPGGGADSKPSPDVSGDASSLPLRFIPPRLGGSLESERDSTSSSPPLTSPITASTSPTSKGMVHRGSSSSMLGSAPSSSIKADRAARGMPGSERFLPEFDEGSVAPFPTPELAPLGRGGPEIALAVPTTEAAVDYEHRGDEEKIYLWHEALRMQNELGFVGGGDDGGNDGELAAEASPQRMKQAWEDSVDDRIAQDFVEDLKFKDKQRRGNRAADLLRSGVGCVRLNAGGGRLLTPDGKRLQPSRGGSNCAHSIQWWIDEAQRLADRSIVKEVSSGKAVTRISKTRVNDLFLQPSPPKKR